MIPDKVVTGVSPGIAIISSPTEHTHVIASNFSSVNAPRFTASIIPWSSLTGINAPLNPPTYEEAITPPFLTWSFKIANAAVVPGAPTLSKPIPSKQSAILSPIAGVGANDKSMIPKGIPNFSDASKATNWPTRVILNAVFLIISHNSPKSFPLALAIAFLTTPGPLTPTFIIASASLTPWKAPAINGLSSGALHKTTNLAQPIESFSLVKSAVSWMISPINFTASILIPVLVDPTFTELQTLLVTFIASGIERINNSSAFVIPLETIAV